LHHNKNSSGDHSYTAMRFWSLKGPFGKKETKWEKETTINSKP